jgi:uncharacterized Zn-binding protein involved in type VI secretion
MPKGPAARVGDSVAHPAPPLLTGSPGSVSVTIGGLPAWRGMPLAAAGPILQAKQAADAAIQGATAAATAAAGTPGAPAAKAAELATKTAAAAAMSAAISAASGGADVHSCQTPLPPNPHGVGIVVSGSATVTINGLPACRVGDTIVESVGPPNTIVRGAPNVIIGG